MSIREQVMQLARANNWTPDEIRDCAADASRWISVDQLDTWLHRIEEGLTDIGKREVPSER